MLTIRSIEFFKSYKISNKHFKYGRNELFCNDGLILSKSYKFMFITFSLITTALAFTTYSILITFQELQNKIISLFLLYSLYSLTLFFLFKAGCMDPGIIERNFRLDLFKNSVKKSFNILLKGNIIKINFCKTCKIVRPPRTSHCATCDNCIEKFDHHCLWIGNCMGKRNYKYFLFFLLLMNLYAMYSSVLSVIFIISNVKGIQNETKTLSENNNSSLNSNLTNKNETANFTLNDTEINVIHNSISAGFCAFVLIFILIFIIFLFGKMFIQHMLLCANNTTFYEDFKNKWRNFPIKGKNPFNLNKSAIQNLWNIFFHRIPQASLMLEIDRDENKYIDYNHCKTPFEPFELKVGENANDDNHLKNKMIP